MHVETCQPVNRPVSKPPPASPDCSTTSVKPSLSMNRHPKTLKPISQTGDTTSSHPLFGQPPTIHPPSGPRHTTTKDDHVQTHPEDRRQARNGASSATGKAVGRTNIARRNKRNQSDDTQQKCIITIKTTRKTLAST
jgi:hypothetical protein